jgi:phytoene synthase
MCQKPDLPSVTHHSSLITHHSSLNYCRRLTHRALSSFPLAFRLLSRPRRDATVALYAFFRVTDDLADGAGAVGSRQAALADWRARLDAALAGAYTHRVHAALHHAVRSFGIDPAHLHAVLDGVETDLGSVRITSHDELERYCDRVASAVGLACLPVWGLRPGVTTSDVLEPARAAGRAFQLTNILRDLGEDLARGRVYLPADELARFDCPPEAWADRGPQFRELMRFQAARARDYYARSAPLTALLSPEGRAVFGLMAGVYRRLLDAIERADYDVFTRRVRVGRLTKLRLFLAAWPVRWGLL